MHLDAAHITLEDLTEDTRMIAEVLGLEATVRQAHRRALLLYDGTNALEVCRQTGLNRRQLRRLLRQHGAQR